VRLGVDTHADVHVAVALDQLGRRLGAVTVATTPAGARELLGWASQFGPIERVGCEGTSSWGLGLDARTRAYVARRTAEGKTKPEIIRCLKRFIARELYQVLTGPPPADRREAAVADHG
jgi:hypothetical protein